MTRYQPLYQLAGSYSPTLDRQFIAAAWPSGGVFGGAVTFVNNTMNVSIAPGKVVVPLAPGGSPSTEQGCALCWWDAAETVTVAAAPTTAGQSRIDLIVAKVRDNNLDSGGFNDFVFQSVTGTAATSPVAPAVPTNSYSLTRVTVPANVTNLNTATQSRAAGALAAPSLIGAGVSGGPTAASGQWFMQIGTVTFDSEILWGQWSGTPPMPGEAGSSMVPVTFPEPFPNGIGPIFITNEGVQDDAHWAGAPPLMPPGYPSWQGFLWFPQRPTKMGFIALEANGWFDSIDNNIWYHPPTVSFSYMAWGW